MMKKIVALCLLLALPSASFGVEGRQIRYVGGTVASLHEGVLGRIETTSDTALIFDFSGGRLEIPFARIESYEYSRQVRHHLGVLPAIAVGLVKQRQRKHLFRIEYRSESGAPQVVIFEVPKQMPRTLLSILQARAPHGCKPRELAKCTQRD